MKKSRNKRKRVLLVVRYPVGGIRTYLRYMYRNFSIDEWDFTLVAPWHLETRMLVDEDLAAMRIDYWPTEENPSAATFSRHVLAALLRKRFCLVHSHGFTSGLCTAPAAALLRVKHILTSHDVLNVSQFAGRKGRVKEWLMGRLLRMIDRIQSVSFDAQSNLREFFPDLGDRRLIVIPNGIEVERFQRATPRVFRKELDLADDVFLIGFLGRFMSQKGFRYLVDAMEILRQRQNLPARPLVLTFGHGGFIREERAAIAERGLEGCFRFLPFVSNTADSILGLDVLVMPSLWEACPLQPMEALVCGTPLIATNCIGLREVIRDTPTTVIETRNGEAIADAIRAHMIEANVGLFRDYRSVAVLRFDARDRAEELKRVYEELLPA